MTDPQATPPAPPAYAAPAATGQKKTLSLISMIAGIVGVVLILTTWPSTILGIAAVILGFLGRSREPYAKGFWLTGLITGIVAIVGSVVWFISVLAIAAAIQNAQ